MSNTVCIHKTFNEIEAELIRAKLEGEGIYCFLKSDNAGGTLPHLTSSEGISIMVDENDQEAAIALIEEGNT